MTVPIFFLLYVVLMSILIDSVEAASCEETAQDRFDRYRAMGGPMFDAYLDAECERWCRLHPFTPSAPPLPPEPPLPPPKRDSRYPRQPLAVFPQWFPRAVKSNERITPLWTFRYGDERVAAVVIDIGRGMHEARFYALGRLIAEDQLRSYNDAIAWADRQRGSMEGTTRGAARIWGTRKVGNGRMSA